MNAVTHQESLVLDLEPKNDEAGQQLDATQPGSLAVNSPAGIMLAALSRGLSPADVREMLALQREWRADEARNAFNEALAAFKKEPVYVGKNKAVGYTTKEGEFVGYKHAELCDVVAAVGPALAKHGLSHRWDVKQSKDWITVTCILKHSAGHSESCEMGGPPDATGKKNPIQSIASTVSYLQRYTLKAITGVAEERDDDDGQGGADADGAGTEQPRAGASAAANTYPDADFERNFPSWTRYIESGRKTADEIVATVKTKKPFTPEQEAKVRAITRAA